MFSTYPCKKLPTSISRASLGKKLPSEVRDLDVGNRKTNPNFDFKWKSNFNFDFEITQLKGKND
jgi:hypothetical protein